MSKANPVAFKDLDEAQLKAITEYYGIDVEEDAKKPVLVAAIVEDNLSWDDYVDSEVPLKPESLVAPEPVVIDPPKEETVTAPVAEVVTAEVNPVLAQANYLIKMERKNPLFEFGKYRFTKDNPYNIMPAEDAQAILTKEEGFRQAFPNELREYYS